MSKITCFLIFADAHKTPFLLMQKYLPIKTAQIACKRNILIQRQIRICK